MHIYNHNPHQPSLFSVAINFHKKLKIVFIICLQLKRPSFLYLHSYAYNNALKTVGAASNSILSVTVAYAPDESSSRLKIRH